MSDVATATDAGVDAQDIAPITPSDLGVATGDDEMPVEIPNTPEAVEIVDYDADTPDEIDAQQTEAAEGQDDEDPDQQATDGDGDDDNGATAEVIEFDFGGNKLEIPKDQVPVELAEKISDFTKETWADYTRKSQAVSEAQSGLDTQRQHLDQMMSLQGEALEYYSRGLQLRDEIQRLSDMQEQLWVTNPDMARRNSDTLSRMQLDLQQTVQAVQHFENELQSQHETRRAEDVETGKARLSKYRENFETEIVPQVVDFVVENFGFTTEEAKANWALNPEMTIMAYESMLYRQMQAEAAKPRTEPAKRATPVTSVRSRGGGAGTAPSNPDNMSMANLRRHLGIVTND